MSGLISTAGSKSKFVGHSDDTASAWVNFNGAGTVAVRTSHNVYAINDHSTGTHSVLFGRAFTVEHYSVSGFASTTSGSGTNGPSVYGTRGGNTGGFQTGFFKFITKMNQDGGTTDFEHVNIQVHGN